jgi:predicted nucleotidyltransferase
MNVIEKNRSKLIELCEKHNVQQLYMFGSVLTDKFNSKSDIDLLIQFAAIDETAYFDNYMDLKEQFEILFQRSIDLVENQAVRNPIFRKVIDREKQLIYERETA